MDSFLFHLRGILFFFQLFLFHVRFDRLFIVRGRLSFLKGNGSCRALRQAVPHAVAVVVADQPCLSVHHCDRALVTGLGAEPAAVAFFFIDPNDLSDHAYLLCRRRRHFIPAEA